MEPEGSLPYSQASATCPSPATNTKKTNFSFWIFNMILFLEYDVMKSDYNENKRLRSWYSMLYYIQRIHLRNAWPIRNHRGK